MTAKQETVLPLLLQEAHDRGASDLFLLPGEPPTFRVSGVLERSNSQVLTADEVEALATGLIGTERVKAIGREQSDVVTTCGVDGVVDGRACIARSLGSVTIVVRLLPRRLPTLQELDVPGVMQEMMYCPNGLIIISGPAGSGKTTTLLALLEHLNQTRAEHIRTVENPLSYRLTPKKAIIIQQEVGSDTPSTLAGIKTAMLQDLDVLMIGELRTAEEVQACITAAETGHLVVVQVHADNPAHAITRMVDAMPEDLKAIFGRKLAAQLRVVLTQRLLPDVKGGRVAAYALLIADNEMRQALQSGGDILTRRLPWPAGCQTMQEGVARLLAEGRIAQKAADEAIAALENQPH